MLSRRRVVQGIGMMAASLLLGGCDLIQELLEPP